MTVIVIGCRTDWRAEPVPDRRYLCAQIRGYLSAPPEPIPVTPRAALWTAAGGSHNEPPNALASALLGLLQLPIEQLRGPACLTGWHAGSPLNLTDVQYRGFTAALRTVLDMPDYLALHAQAGRVAAAWTDHSRRTP